MIAKDVRGWIQLEGSLRSPPQAPSPARCHEFLVVSAPCLDVATGEANASSRGSLGYTYKRTLSTPSCEEQASLGTLVLV